MKNPIIKNNYKQGMALLSVIVIAAISVIVISVMLVVTVLNLQTAFNLTQAKKAKTLAESVADDFTLRYLRQRSSDNYYSSWSEPCLQIENMQCKMELNLAPAGGEVDSLAKSGFVLRHLNLELTVLEDDSVLVSKKQETY